MDGPAILELSECGRLPSSTQVDPGNVMRINGRWYDVGAFQRLHPGGPVALSLGIGRDATVLFQSSHPFVSSARLEAQLKQLELPPAHQKVLNQHFAALIAREDAIGFKFNGRLPGLTAAEARSGVLAPAPSPAASTAQPDHAGKGPHAAAALAADGFEHEVKAIALAYFAGEAARRGVPLRDATKATPERWAEFAVLGAAFLLCVPPLVSGSWLALAVAPTLLWLWMVNFWHDAAHFAMSSDWRVNAALTYLAPWFSSPLMWYHQHVIGHHAYTNLEGWDPDLRHSPFWRLNHSVKWKPLHGWQTVITPVLWLLAVWMLLVDKPLEALRTGVYNRSVVFMALPAWRVVVHLLGRLLVLASLHAWPWYAFPGQPAKALLFSVVPIATFSLWFMACTQVNHHAEELSDARDSRWYRHQVMTSHTVAPLSTLAFFLSGGLNLQIEHHLFPTVNHCHLRALQPLIEAAARKYSVPYCKSNTMLEAFVKLWSHLAKMGRQPTECTASDYNSD